MATILLFSGGVRLPLPRVGTQACSSTKGIAALRLAREMEITALLVLRRIRHGLGSEEQPKMTGTVEVDETYVGGRPRYKGVSKRGAALTCIRNTVESVFSLKRGVMARSSVSKKHLGQFDAPVDGCD